VRPERYLAIETSSPRLSLAIGDGSKIVGSYVGEHDWRHSDRLFDGMAALLRRAKWPLPSLSGVTVSIGPGSFTGIRIGLAVARALGQSLRIPVVGISSLEIMAAGAKTKARWLAPQIDALRDQVFFGLFQRNGHGTLRRVMKEAMASPRGLSKKLKRRAGRESLWISPLQGCYPDARALLELARPRLAKAGPLSYRSALPLYIRQAAAEERK